MPRTVKQLRTRLETLKGEKALLDRQLAEEGEKLARLRTTFENREKARALIQEGALLTQRNLEVKVGSIVTTAIQAVFGDGVAFRVEFDTKRGRTECLLRVEPKAGQLVDPMNTDGGGLVDVISLSLRMAFWHMDQSRPLMILDEPLKNMSADMMPLAAEMVRMIAGELGMQLILVSHEADLKAVADRAFEVYHDGQQSVVRQIGDNS